VSEKELKGPALLIVNLLDKILLGGFGEIKVIVHDGDVSVQGAPSVRFKKQKH
jgi:hypothetical protein